jgi:hypothetical protein
MSSSAAPVQKRYTNRVPAQYGNSADNKSLLSLVQNQSFIYSGTIFAPQQESIYNEMSENDINHLVEQLEAPAQVLPDLVRLLK